jgi:hypothetical protein
VRAGHDAGDGMTDDAGSARPHVVVGAVAGLARWLGAAVGPPPASDGVEPTAPPEPSVGFAVLGALIAVEEHVSAALRAGVDAARATAALAADAMPAEVRRTVDGAVRALDERGRAAVESGSAEAGRIGSALTSAATSEPAIVRMVEDVVDRVQWRVVDALLPGVLERLAAEPERMQVIIHGQSRGMVEELARQARSRSVEGDELVDRVVGRVLRRPRPPRRVEPVLDDLDGTVAIDATSSEP